MSPAPLQATTLADTRPAGDLRRRLQLNFGRLHDPEFSFESAITAFTAREAPGDWLGRTLLGLTLDAQVLGREAPRAEETIRRWPEATNGHGYIGRVLPAGQGDENQIGGHNGMLRGLCEFYLWKKDSRALEAIRGIVANLMLPSRGLYAQYPDSPLDKLKGGPVSGLTIENDGAWVGLSTDIGTVFFTLDGLTQAYVVDPTPALRDLVETMIARYAQLDILRLGAQTHATLTTLRGILRWYLEVDPRAELLALVRARFQSYLDLARTEHHGNFNWFGRPEWTETCAIIDSFMLAVQLWSVTREAGYLGEAHRIYHNALCHHQRPNGGFGCDHCTGAADQRFVQAFKWFEAPWCCTMRGAEGLACAARYAAFTDPARPREAWLPFYFDGSVTIRAPGGTLGLTVSSEYPYAGRVTYSVTEGGGAGQWRLRFFVPPGVAAGSLAVRRAGRVLPLTVEAGFAVVTTDLAVADALELEFPIAVAAESARYPAAFPGGLHFMHGPLLLAAETETAVPPPAAGDLRPLGGGRYQCRRTQVLLTPIDGLTYLPEAVARTRRLQAVFTP
ncbi:MAG: glycoside hydrolase family 127 protein [Verrucomicrobia bacterium]|nr:glycoside hydrolase family 127 protein [Verrucomicrobiota bacterium]